MGHNPVSRVQGEWTGGSLVKTGKGGAGQDAFAWFSPGKKVRKIRLFFAGGFDVNVP